MADDVVVNITANIEEAINNFVGFAGAIGIAYEAFNKLTQIISQGIADYQTAGTNAVVLGAALKAQGEASESAVQGIQDLASAIQSTTQYSSEATIQASGLLVSIGHLDSEGVQTIMPHIADMAQALGISLPQAAEMVARSMDGSRNMLSRYGIEIDKNADSSTKLTEVNDQLATHFGGLATAVGGDPVSSMQKLENANKELSEQMGRNFVTSAQPIIDFLTKLKQGWADELKAENDYNTSHQKIIDGIATTTDKINENTKTIKDLQEQYDMLKQSLGGGIDQTEEMTNATRDQMDVITKEIGTLSQENFHLQDQVLYVGQAASKKEELKKANDDWLTTQKNIINEMDKDNKAHQDSISKIDDEISATQALIEKEKEYKISIDASSATLVTETEALNKAAIAQADTAAGQQTKIEKDETAINTTAALIDKYAGNITVVRELWALLGQEETARQADIDAISTQKALQEGLNNISTEAVNTTKQLVLEHNEEAKSVNNTAEQYRQAGQDLNSAGEGTGEYDSLINRLNIDLARGTISQQEFDKAVANLDFKEASKAIQQYGNVAKDVLNDIKSYMDEVYAAEETAAQDTYSAQEDALKTELANNQITQDQYDAQLAADQKAEQDAENKAKHDAAIFNRDISLANATINVAEQVTANIGNPILAAVIAAAGAVEIGLIAATPIPSLAQGGIVPATPGGKQVNVAEGGSAEAIIPLSKIGNMGQNQMVHTVIQLDSKTLYDAVTKGIRDRKIPLATGSTGKLAG